MSWAGTALLIPSRHWDAFRETSSVGFFRIEIQCCVSMFLPAMFIPPSVGSKNNWKMGVSEFPGLIKCCLINHRMWENSPKTAWLPVPTSNAVSLPFRQLLSGAESLQLIADLLKSIDRISEVSEDGH